VAAPGQGQVVERQVAHMQPAQAAVDVEEAERRCPRRRRALDDGAGARVALNGQVAGDGLQSVRAAPVLVRRREGVGARQLDGVGLGSCRWPR
jgi:hypothetical protein